MSGVPQVSRGSRPGIPHLDSTLKVHSSHHRVGDAFYPPHVPKLLRRYYGAGDLHFITGSCYGREPVLHTAQRRDPFLTVLEQVRKRYRFVVMGYVVMPEHFHLLISEPRKGDPSTVMQALKLGFARRLLAAIAKPRSRKPRDLGHPELGGVRHLTSGKRDSMISTCGPNGSASRNCVTFTAIRWYGAW